MSDIATLNLLCRVEKLHTSDINSCAFSPDGRYVACASSDRLAVVVECDTSSPVKLATVAQASGRQARQLAGHKYHVNVCRFSPCGTLLATGSTDCAIRIWNVGSGECVAATAGHRGAVRSLAFSADGTHILSSASDDSLVVINISSATVVKSWKTMTEGALLCCDWTTHGWHVIVGSSNGQLMVWDAFDRRLVAQEQNAHDMGVCCLVDYVTDEEYVATGGTDTNIRIWQLKYTSGNVQLRLKHVLAGHSSSVYTLTVSPDKHYMLSGSADRTVRLWKLDTGAEVCQANAHQGFVSCCSFSPCGRFAVSSGGDRVLHLWKLTQSDGTLATSSLAQEDTIEAPINNAAEWSADDVCQWMASLKMDKYSAAFRQASVDGPALQSVHAQQLFKTFAIESPGDRHTILGAISELFPTSRSVPNEFICPISMEIMRDPVVASDGFSYDRSAIVSWITSGRHTSPLTNLPMTSSLVFANNNLKTLIKTHLDRWQSDTHT